MAGPQNPLILTKGFGEDISKTDFHPMATLGYGETLTGEDMGVDGADFFDYYFKQMNFMGFNK